MAEINVTQREINGELDKVKTPKLSLNAEERSGDTGFVIPSMAGDVRASGNQCCSGVYERIHAERGRAAASQ